MSYFQLGCRKRDGLGWTKTWRDDEKEPYEGTRKKEKEEKKRSTEWEETRAQGSNCGQQSNEICSFASPKEISPDTAKWFPTHVENRWWENGPLTGESPHSSFIRLLDWKDHKTTCHLCRFSKFVSSFAFALPFVGLSLWGHISSSLCKWFICDNFLAPYKRRFGCSLIQPCSHIHL